MRTNRKAEKIVQHKVVMRELIIDLLCCIVLCHKQMNTSTNSQRKHTDTASYTRIQFPIGGWQILCFWSSFLYFSFYSHFKLKWWCNYVCNCVNVDVSAGTSFFVCVCMLCICVFDVYACVRDCVRVCVNVETTYYHKRMRPIYILVSFKHSNSSSSSGISIIRFSVLAQRNT